MLAAARLRPNKKVVGLGGDTSFLMASSDFLTICEQKLPVVIAIHHDQRIGMIDNMHTKAYGRAYASEIGRVDFVKYAEAFGATGIRVEDPADTEAAWDAALAATARSSSSSGPATSSPGPGRWPAGPKRARPVGRRPLAFERDSGSCPDRRLPALGRWQPHLQTQNAGRRS